MYYRQLIIRPLFWFRMNNEMHFISKIIFMTMSGIFLSSHPANSQDVELSDCSCVTEPIESSTDALGNITSLSGDVLYSAASGFEKAAIGAPLISGSQITVGINAAANISVGSSCNLPIPASSDASISQLSGPGTTICVKISDDPQAVVAAPTSPVITPILSALVTGGIVGTIVIISEGEDSSSN
jgi:hypothetical protein